MVIVRSMGASFLEHSSSGHARSTVTFRCPAPLRTGRAFLSRRSTQCVSPLWARIRLRRSAPCSAATRPAHPCAVVRTLACSPCLMTACHNASIHRMPPRTGRMTVRHSVFSNRSLLRPMCDEARLNNPASQDPDDVRSWTVRQVSRERFLSRCRPAREPRPTVSRMRSVTALNVP